MKTILLSFSIILFTLLCSCSGKTGGNEQIRIAVLRGPSAIAFAEWLDEPPVINGKTCIIEWIDSPERMQAELIKGGTDVAVLPMISAVNLYNKGVKLELLGCPVWGTLYLVGKSEAGLESGTADESKKIIHFFGSGTTPDILARYYLETHLPGFQADYSFATPPEIVQGLLLGKIETAVLSEPFVSIALQKDSTLQVLADLNNLFADKAGFPQTAVVCTPQLASDRDALTALLSQSCSFAETHPDSVLQILEHHDLFSSGLLTPESLERCKIRFESGREAKPEIQAFLQLILENEPKALGSKLPDTGFYE